MLTDIKRNSLVAQVIERLTDQIKSGQWVLGYKLPPENALAAELGVGRSTVREAVRVLAHNGYLEVRQGSGTFVIATQAKNNNTSISSEKDNALQQRLRRAKILDVWEVRRVIELEAARLAAVRRDDDDLVRIEAALLRREKAGSLSASAEFVQADLEFHLAVIDAAHNPVLSDLFNAFAEVLQEALALLVSDEASRVDTGFLHKQLAEAIRAKDSELAAQATLAHLSATSANLRKLLNT